MPPTDLPWEIRQQQDRRRRKRKKRTVSHHTLSHPRKKTGRKINNGSRLRATVGSQSGHPLLFSLYLHVCLLFCPPEETVPHIQSRPFPKLVSSNICQVPLGEKISQNQDTNGPVVSQMTSNEGAGNQGACPPEQWVAKVVVLSLPLPSLP